MGRCQGIARSRRNSLSAPCPGGRGNAACLWRCKILAQPLAQVVSVGHSLSEAPGTARISKKLCEMGEDDLEQYVLSSQARQIAGHILAAYLERTFEGVDGLATSKVSVSRYD
jgi:hypothetical protein